MRPGMPFGVPGFFVALAADANRSFAGLEVRKVARPPMYACVSSLFEDKRFLSSSDHVDSSCCACGCLSRAWSRLWVGRAVLRVEVVLERCPFVERSEVRVHGRGCCAHAFLRLARLWTCLRLCPRALLSLMWLDTVAAKFVLPTQPSTHGHSQLKFASPLSSGVGKATRGVVTFFLKFSVCSRTMVSISPHVQVLSRHTYASFTSLRRGG